MKVKIVSIAQGTGEFKGKTAEDIIVYAARVSSPRHVYWSCQYMLYWYRNKNEV